MVIQNEQSVDAAKKMADLTERSLRISTRAYLFVDEANLQSPINTGQYPLPRVILKNSGKTPAFKHRTRLQYAFFSDDDLEKARKGIMPALRPMSDRALALWVPTVSLHSALKGETGKHLKMKNAQ
jgi:hypothetical protein